MKESIAQELVFQTTRSGGKGGQHVNKVETAVIAYFDIEGSQILEAGEKERLKEKLSNRINSEGKLWVKAQEHRTQLSNKDEAVKKIEQLVRQALRRKKPRLATKPSRQSKEKRLEAKKRFSKIKEGRRRIDPGNY